MSDLFKNDENLVKKASYLKFLARELADSLKTGNFRSLFRGQGIEFEGDTGAQPRDSHRCCAVLRG